MQHLISQQLKRYFPAQRHFLIGLSGGVDSVVLLHLFSQCPNLNLRAVHIHHGLSQNADHWAKFCEEFCLKLQLPFEVRKVIVIGNQGLEGNARQARYQAISEAIYPNEVFVTAHHLDDQVETFFLALKRGSGLQGLSAMQVVGNWQNFAIFRPLLSSSKAEILDYAVKNNLTWINDESNADNRFERNFLRNQILPLLNQRFAQFSQMVAHSAQHCAEQQMLIEELLNEELNARIGEKNQLNVTGFESLSVLKQQQLIRLWLKKNRMQMPSKVQLQAVISELIFAKSDRQPEVRIGDNVVRRYQDDIFVLLPNNPKHEHQIKITSTEITFSKKTGEIHRLPLPIELQNEQLTVQFGVTGKVKQYGKVHHEEMKKIWKMHAVPLWDRKETPLIFWQDQLVAVLY